MSKARLPRLAELTIAKFKRRLIRHYPDARAYLFGSWAKGTWLKDSDFDIIVLSKKFRSQAFVKRMAAVRRLAPEDSAFEILAYTPEEFREVSRRSVTIQDAQEYWIRIA